VLADDRSTVVVFNVTVGPSDSDVPNLRQPRELIAETSAKLAIGEEFGREVGNCERLTGDAVTSEDSSAHRVLTHLPEMHHTRNGPPHHPRSSLVALTVLPPAVTRRSDIQHLTTERSTKWASKQGVRGTMHHIGDAE
jgi:hypothetical protein